MDDEIRISKAQLTEWAESLIHMNHHGTLVQREIASGNTDRASNLSERARKRAWKMLNELFAKGGSLLHADLHAPARTGKRVAECRNHTGEGNWWSSKEIRKRL